MKVFWYIYYYAVKNSERYTPHKRDHYAQASFELAIGFTTVIGLIVLKFLDNSGSWAWVEENWPYDYGHMHSKNWIAPASILILLCFIITRKIVKKYFESLSIRQKIFRVFCSANINSKLGGYSSVIFWIYSVWLAVCIGSSSWALVACSLVLLLIGEYLVRRNFKDFV